MALSALTQLEIRYAGSDTNGGGFVAGAAGTDYSKQNSANSGGSNGSTTDVGAIGTATITSATAAFTAAITGNIIFLSGGTGSLANGWYQATYVTATSITVDRNVAAGTGITLNIGGALGSPGQAGALLTVNGMIGWIKYTSGSPFVLANATANTSGGPVSLSLGVILQGYDVTRGDMTGNQPVLSWGSVSLGSTPTYAYASTGVRVQFTNLAVNGNSVAYGCGFNLASGTNALGCTAENCNGTAGVGFNSIATSDYALVEYCLANTCLIGFNSITTAIGCTATGCATDGFNSCITHVGCLAYANGTGFSSGQSMASYVGCTADTNTVSGITIASVNNTAILNCVVSGNLVGITTGSNPYVFIYNVAYYLNGTTLSGTAARGTPVTVTLSANPYVTAGSQYAPNNTAGGGAVLRGAAIGPPGQTDNQDIGAVQHADPAGSGGYLPALQQLGM